MLHSIVIPFRNCLRTLTHTLWSVDRSAHASGLRDYEVIIVRSYGVEPAPSSTYSRILYDHGPRGIFNKPRVLNIGIEAARGDILSFLDADMLVGKWWMGTTIELMRRNNPRTRLAYRVRQLVANGQDNTNFVCGMLEMAGDARARVLDRWFGQYEGYTNVFEAYGTPEAGNVMSWKSPTRCPSGPVFGNSQFSIRREALGDLRFNEQYEGAGCEDYWLTREYWRREGASYRGMIVTNGGSALLHIHHHRPMVEESDWCTPETNRANNTRYESS